MFKRLSEWWLYWRYRNITRRWQLLRPRLQRWAESAQPVLARPAADEGNQEANLPGLDLDLGCRPERDLLAVGLRGGDGRRLERPLVAADPRRQQAAAEQRRVFLLRLGHSW